MKRQPVFSAVSLCLNRYVAWEDRLTLHCNQLQRSRGLRWLFAWASRLGNGVGWYGLIAALLLLYGAPLLQPVLWLLFSAALGTAIYILIKRRTARVRPLHRNHHLMVSILPLDRYSFPSGHTLHAVNFAIQLAVMVPALTGALLASALLIALSRLVLGLHYLSDVLAGAVIGGLLAWFSLQLQPAL